jgi:hypothetical protein
VEAQDGRSVGRKRLVDRGRSRYCTYMNFNRRLKKFGSEGKEHNPTVSLRFSITECVRVSYNQGFMGKVGEVVSV